MQTCDFCGRECDDVFYDNEYIACPDCVHRLDYDEDFTFDGYETPDDDYDEDYYGGSYEAEQEYWLQQYAYEYPDCDVPDFMVMDVRLAYSKRVLVQFWRWLKRLLTPKPKPIELIEFSDIPF